MQEDRAAPQPLTDFDRFHPYEALCHRIEALAAWKPKLCEVRMIGRSVEGRDIPLLVITDSSSGPPDAKPGFLVHGNIHAVELSGSACALYLAHYLLARAGDDPVTANLLQRNAFHIVLRVCLDGAEEALVRQHPVRSRETVELRKNCVTPEDINGDGYIRAMRVPDAAGAWYAPDDEPRLAVPRLPGDSGGQRYRLTTEGLIHDWDGGTWSGPAATGYDFNRNWPEKWRPRHQQWGAGRYPFSEPEVRAVADYVLDHPNVFGVFGLHNGTNAILRPPTSGSDSEVESSDLLEFRRLAALGAEITGFPAKAIHEYRHELAAPGRLHGTFTEWGYRHCGLFAMEIEFGNLYNGVGYTTERIFGLTPEEERQRERDCLAWHDAHPEAGAFAEWEPFDHPQLGPVELGGFIPEVFYNVIPEQRLDVWDRTRRFLFELARRGPRLELSGIAATPLGDGLFRVACQVTNEGLLPTHVTALGGGLSHIEGVCVEVERHGCVTFVAGRNRTDVGHLGASESRELAWVLRADPGTAITIVAHGPRAGRCEAMVALER